jgi:hypothetical protein
MAFPSFDIGDEHCNLLPHAAGAKSLSGQAGSIHRYYWYISNRKYIGTVSSMQLFHGVSK